MCSHRIHSEIYFCLLSFFLEHIYSCSFGNFLSETSSQPLWDLFNFGEDMWFWVFMLCFVLRWVYQEFAYGLHFFKKAVLNLGHCFPLVGSMCNVQKRLGIVG